ncbi:hypothetical protein OC842_004708 [Tilletia horrida]|uniref:Zn(2)-C6 fungal-type domain-containing protein n=1 Tax=Tilletia horrida TaxID=155126 RepID=A0AAN6JJA3_9BASI|nr:hypothetical protein OC842_004708 [Tilletia horrida]
MNDYNAAKAGKSRRRSSSQAELHFSDVGKPKRIIKRNRKITSCFECREKKQKCDRVHPICGECAAINGKCTWVSTIEEVEALRIKRQQHSDGGNSSDAASACSPASSEPIASRYELDLARRTSSAMFFGGQVTASTAASGTDSDLFCAGPSTSAALLQSAILHQNNGLVSELRVRAARADAVAEVLTAVKVDLPPIDAVRELLNIFHTRVSWFCDAALPDLFWPRIEPLLAWWYSGRQGKPADPVMLPLLMVMLAHGLQTKRTSDPRIPASWGPSVAIVEGCSSEVNLLVAAGMMIVMLQMSCPANWAIAYSAPLDLIRTCLLRALWHVGEHNLQFASTLIASCVKLAQSAGLHRDPRNWKGISDEEVYVRRNLWQNVAFLETFVSNRIGQPPVLTPERSDTRIPDRYEDLKSLYAKLPAEAGTGATPPPPPLSWFQYHQARFEMAQLLLAQNSIHFGVSLPGKEAMHRLSYKYEEWRERLPAIYAFQSDATGAPRALPRYDPLGEIENDSVFYQSKLLELIFLACQTTIHRPFLSAPAQSDVARQSLRRCLTSSQRMIWLVADMMDRDPPFVILNILAHHLFGASVILAVYSHDSTTNEGSPNSLTATLELGLNIMSRIAGNVRLHQVARQAATYIETTKQLIQAAREQSRKDARMRAEQYQAAAAAAASASASSQVLPAAQAAFSAYAGAFGQAGFGPGSLGVPPQSSDMAASTSAGSGGLNYGMMPPPASNDSRASLSHPDWMDDITGTASAGAAAPASHNAGGMPGTENNNDSSSSMASSATAPFHLCFGMCQDAKNAGAASAPGAGPGGAMAGGASGTGTGCSSSSCPYVDDSNLRGGPTGFSTEWLDMLNNGLIDADRPIFNSTSFAMAATAAAAAAGAAAAATSSTSSVTTAAGPQEQPLPQQQQQQQPAPDDFGFLRFYAGMMGEQNVPATGAQQRQQQQQQQQPLAPPVPINGTAGSTGPSPSSSWTRQPSVGPSASGSAYTLPTGMEGILNTFPQHTATASTARPGSSSMPSPATSAVTAPTRPGSVPNGLSAPAMGGGGGGGGHSGAGAGAGAGAEPSHDSPHQQQVMGGSTFGGAGTTNHSSPHHLNIFRPGWTAASSSSSSSSSSYHHQSGPPPPPPPPPPPSGQHDLLPSIDSYGAGFLGYQSPSLQQQQQQQQHQHQTYGSHSHQHR